MLLSFLDSDQWIPVKFNDILKSYIFVTSLILVVFFVYYPCLQAQFINLDDPNHVINNRGVYLPLFDSFGVIFGQLVNKVYIPLTTLSFNLEQHFFGFNPFVYHFDNILLHILNAILVLLLAKRFGLSTLSSFLVALLFAINPMKVESVAWVSERKDLLYAFFYILSLNLYLSYCKSRSSWLFIATLLMGILSILAKPMAISLPLILLLFDWYFGRLNEKNVLLEKLPFFLYCIIIGWISFYLNSSHSVHNIFESILIWIWCFDFYLWKFFWPFQVYPYYQLPEPISILNWPYFLSSFGFLLLLSALIYWRNNKHLIFGFLYYLFSIFFLISFENWGFSVVCDRYMYLPCLGFCLMIGVAFFEKVRIKSLSLIFIVFYLFLLGIKSFYQCSIWENSSTYWNEMLKHYPARSYVLRGDAYFGYGQDSKALMDYSSAIRFNPLYAEAYFKRGFIYFKIGEYKNALNDFQYAVSLGYKDPELYIGLSKVKEILK